MTTTYTVSGASPVSFVSENTSGEIGKQYQIPLAALTSTASGSASDLAATWLGNASIASPNPDYTLVPALITTLISQGFLTVVVTKS